MSRGTHPNLVISREKQTSKIRRIFQITGLDTGLDFGVHNNSLKNLSRGLLERVFYVEGKNGLEPPLPPKSGVFTDRLAYFGKRVAAIVGPHAPIEREQYPLLYSGRRRAIYSNALNSIGERPVTRHDAKLKTFVKAEKINFTAKPDPAPRVIQPRDPRYNVEVGRYLKLAEHSIYHAIDKIWGGPTVLKGYNISQLGTILHDIWGEFQRPCAIGFDAKRFDQHVSVAALRWEHSVYNRIFKCSNLERLLSYQLVNRGVGRASDGICRYKVDGCRMSGDINTALGNCLLSCAITHAITKGIRCRLINNGDDCVLFFEEEELTRVNDRLTQWSEFGFQVKFEAPIYELEKVEFCQMQPVNANGWIMVRNPYICMSKDTYSVTPWHNAKAGLKWVASVGECGMSLSGGVPILQEYYKAMMGVSKQRMNIKNDVWFSDSGFARLAASGNRRETHICEDARWSFYRAFGVTPEAQLAVEAELRNYVNSEVLSVMGLYTNPNLWNNLLTPQPTI